MLVITKKTQTAASLIPCTCTPGLNPQHPGYDSGHAGALCTVLTKHQLSAEFRPDEIVKSGWDFHAVSGTATTLPQRGYRGQRYRGGLALLTHNSMRFSLTMHSLSGAVNMILGDNCTSLNSQGSLHSSGTSPSLHQAVTWSLSSPFYNDAIHLTGVCIFPNEGNI